MRRRPSNRALASAAVNAGFTGGGPSGGGAFVARAGSAGRGPSGTGRGVRASCSYSDRSIVWAFPSSRTTKSSRFRSRTNCPFLSRATTFTSTSSVPPWNTGAGWPADGACARRSPRPTKHAAVAMNATARRGKGLTSEPHPGDNLHAAHGTRRDDLPVRRRVHHRIDRRVLHGVEDVVGLHANRQAARARERDVASERKARIR